MLRLSLRLASGVRPGSVRSSRAVLPAAVVLRRFASTQPSEIVTDLPLLLETVAAAPTTLHSNQVGYLDLIGLGQGWWPLDVIQHALEITHAYTGLPWWATIAATTFVVRALLFPLYVKLSDTMAAMLVVKPELDKCLEDMKTALSTTEQQKVAFRRRRILKEHGIKQRYLMMPLLQLPLALGFFNGIRHMANYPVEGFVDGGIYWFTNLSAADPYLGLQVLTAATFVGFMKLGGELGLTAAMGPLMKKFMTYMPVLLIPITAKLSAGIVVYFFANTLCMITQTALIRAPWFRSACGLRQFARHPPPPPDNRGIVQTMKDKFAEQTAKGRAKVEDQQRVDQLATKNRELVARHKSSKKYAYVVKKGPQESSP